MTSSVYIAKNVYGGDGLGRLGDGRVVFVPGAWAGEQVKAEITEERRGYVKARLVEIEEASADRIPCEMQLPGMVYADLAYAAEVRTKEQQLVEFLERARLPLAAETLTLHKFDKERISPFNYRNKVTYHLGRRGKNWVLGYHTEPSHEIVDVENDPLARPEINRELKAIRRAVFTLLTTGPERVRRETEAKG